MRLNHKLDIRVGIALFVGIFFFIFTSSATAQNIVSISTSSWLSMKQQLCIQRGTEALRLANITDTQSNEWLVQGEANNTVIVLKCIADDGTTNLINPTVNRVLLNLTISGSSSTSNQLTKLRNCIQEHVFKGRSSCWSSNKGNSPKVLNTSKSTYTANEPITVTFQGMPANRSDEWITIVPMGTPTSVYDHWTYLNGKTEGTLNFKGLPLGTYEVRAFYSATDDTVRAQHTFTVR